MKFMKIFLLLATTFTMHLSSGMDSAVPTLVSAPSKIVTSYSHRKSSLYEHTFRAHLGSKKGETISAIVCDITKDVGIIRSFETEKKFRNSKDKIGTFLFQECIHFLIKKNCSKITWVAIPLERDFPLETLISIYEKLICKLPMVTRHEIKKETTKAYFSLWILKPQLPDSNAHDHTLA